MAFSPGWVPCDSVWLSLPAVGPSRLAKPGGGSPVASPWAAVGLCHAPLRVSSRAQAPITAAQRCGLGQGSSHTRSQLAHLSKGAVWRQGQKETEQKKHVAGQMVISATVAISFNNSL